MRVIREYPLPALSIDREPNDTRFALAIHGEPRYLGLTTALVRGYAIRPKLMVEETDTAEPVVHWFRWFAPDEPFDSCLKEGEQAQFAGFVNWENKFCWYLYEILAKRGPGRPRKERVEEPPETVE